MELQEIHTKYKLKIEDIFDREYSFNIFSKNKILENTPEDISKALLENTAVMRYMFETNTIIIKHVRPAIDDITIQLDSMNEKQTKYVIILRNLFNVYGVRTHETTESKNLLGEYFYLVYALLFRELVYR